MRRCTGLGVAPKLNECRSIGADRAVPTLLPGESEQQLQINVLQGSSYAVVAESPNFRGLPLSKVLPQYLTESKTVGRNKVLRAFRLWVREQLA